MRASNLDPYIKIVLNLFNLFVQVALSTSVFDRNGSVA